MSHHDHEIDAADTHRKRRRRLLATLGMGLAGAYIAPTLFSVGQAQAWDGHRRSRPSRSRPSRSRPSWSRPSRSRPSWSRPSRSRPSHSRPSRHDGAYRRHDRARRDHDHRQRDYRDDPVRIVEDIVFGRRW